MDVSPGPTVPERALLMMGLVLQKGREARSDP